MGYSMPQIPYLQGFSALGQSVAQTGTAIAEAPLQSQKIKMMYDKFRDLNNAKQQLKSEIIQMAGSHWTPNQIRQFSAKIDGIDNVDALIKIGGEFGTAWQYYKANEDAVKIVPQPFQTFAGYQKVVDPQIKETKRMKTQGDISKTIGGIMQPQQPAAMSSQEPAVPFAATPPQQGPMPPEAQAPTTEQEFYSQLQGKLPTGTTVSELKESPEYLAATKSFAPGQKPMTEYQKESLEMRKRGLEQSAQNLALRRQELARRYEKSTATDEGDLLKEQRSWMSLKDQNHSKQLAVNKAISAADKNRGILLPEVASELYNNTGLVADTKEDLIKLFDSIVDNGQEIERTLEDIKQIQKTIRKNPGVSRGEAGANIQRQRDEQINAVIKKLNELSKAGFYEPGAQGEGQAIDEAKAFAREKNIPEATINEAIQQWQIEKQGGTMSQIGSGYSTQRQQMDKYQQAAKAWLVKRGNANPSQFDIDRVANNPTFRQSVGP